MKHILPTIIFLVTAFAGFSADREVLPYGDFSQWITRNIKESRIIGGETRQVYEIGPTKTINGDEAYEPQGGSPWATSNVMAKVVGITKTSNAVYPDEREPGNKCVKMTSIVERCHAIGLINIDVMVAGSIFLGRMYEPIKSTSNPYGKMEMGIPFTKRPKAVVYDYRLEVPADGKMLYSSGFSKKKTWKGTDKADVLIFLQRRWEDKDGNIYAKRVGTGRELLGKSTSGWVDGHKLDVHYGDISGEPFYKPNMALLTGDGVYQARNSKGEMVPVQEVGWDDPSATPTHMLLMFSSGSGKPYVGTPGMVFWVDNVALEY